ncbi:hypothetical protein TBR22_A16520 [Luteitalea sp. TBR-22]|uniref:hypothetical protein n=1 Tax=Luteitalea sp. TBR-22 TaxID=2802971 RepID=UPI001AF7A6BD|nr:hypothetical protein [Luteitalea sp. TBR-22]BCS32438.1 hypothetical protein TBR22_A16520 [Luteitalea sp. TBR-22]
MTPWPLALLLVIPLTTGVGWEVLRYRGIPPHVVDFGAEGLRVEVNASAAPLVYPLDSPRWVRGLRAEGRVVGALRTDARRQGERGADDYALRVGLVEVGTRRPGWLERKVAPAWVQRLFALAPPDLGIAGIRFFNVAVSPSQIGQSRQHPASALISERVVAAPNANGGFTITVDLDAPLETAAVWISVDGDDTRSRYTLALARLELRLEVPPAGDRARQVRSAPGGDR